MLPRMAKDWESAYADGDTPWDKGYAAPPLREYLEGRGAIRGRVLVPGCGTGHDVRLLAGMGAAEVVGLDLAPRALREAGRFPRAGGERYEAGDFLDLPEHLRGSFDWVVEHTCLCAINPSGRERYARSVAQALRPGGRLLAVLFRAVPDFDGEGPPFPISGAEIEGLFGETFDTLERFVPERTYPGRPVGCEEVRVLRLR